MNLDPFFPPAISPSPSSAGPKTFGGEGACGVDYFLRLAALSPLCIRVANLELVHMSEGGVSAQQTRRRLEEVRMSYQRAFGFFWVLPFLLRYLRRAWTRLCGQ